MRGVSATALAAFTLDGVWVVIAILAVLTVLALSRSIGSVCSKDVLGKTVG